MPGDAPADLERVALLADPLRRRLFEFITASGGWVSREDAAVAMGSGRSTIAFHLDKLAAAGLLDVTRRRPEGRSGPGAGRPAKLYRRRRGDVAASFPPRHYEIAARILLRAAATGADVGEVARSLGREVGRDAGASPLSAVLSDLGFAPASTEDAIVFDNCPFHALASEAPATICAVNVAFVSGVVDVCGRGVEAVPSAGGRCCVTIRQRPH